MRIKVIITDNKGNVLFDCLHNLLPNALETGYVFGPKPLIEIREHGLPLLLRGYTITPIFKVKDNGG